MSSWIPRTTRTGIEYGQAEAQYYWDTGWNPGASFDNNLGTYDLALPNCTTYAYGRVQEMGAPAPISGWHNASAWDSYLINSWTWINYNEAYLEVGDLVVWDSNSRNHVAVVEVISGGNIYVSESYYTSDNGTASGDRSPGVWGATKQSVNDYGVQNYPNRYFHYGLITFAYGVLPDKILKNPVNYDSPGTLKIFAGMMSRKRRRRKIYV